MSEPTDVAGSGNGNPVVPVPTSQVSAEHARSDATETAIEIENGHSIFEKVMAPATAAALFLGFGVQPILPIMHPAIVAMSGVSLAIAMMTTYSSTLFGKRWRWIPWLNAASLLAVACSFAWQTLYMTRARGEMHGTCMTLKASFTVKPDSNVSDAYLALHCDVFASLDDVGTPWGAP